MIPKTMKAVVLTGPTQAENICLSDVPVPQVRPGWVLIRIRAFGLNHSEQILRLGEIQADYIQKPIIPVLSAWEKWPTPPTALFIRVRGTLPHGGNGPQLQRQLRPIRLLPESHVFPVETELSWEKLAGCRKPISLPGVPCSSVYSSARTTPFWCGAAPARWGTQPSAWQKPWAAGLSPPLTEKGSCPC